MTEIATSDRKILSPQARTFVRELLYWAGTVARAESRAKGSQSSTAVVCDVLELGVVGTGNRGTKGVGKAPSEEGEPIKIDPVGALKYRALGDTARRVADAIIADGRGDVMSAESFGQRRYEVSFLVRVGLILAVQPTRERWATKFAQGDPRPAESGAETFAQLLIEDAAKEWGRSYQDNVRAILSKPVPLSAPSDDNFDWSIPVRLSVDPFAHIRDAIER